MDYRDVHSKMWLKFLIKFWMFQDKLQLDCELCSILRNFEDTFV